MSATLRRECNILRAVFVCAVAAVITLLTACSSTSKFRSKNSPATLSAIMLLPTEVPSGLNRERVAYIARSVNAELRSRGYEVIDTDPACNTKGCSNASRLFEKYGLSGIASLELKSVHQDNFLAGYYNGISGTLSLTDRDGKDLISVSRKESERGGLLFSSGQLIEGIRATIRNVKEKDNSFEILADKFAARIVGELPPASNYKEAADLNASPRLSNIKLNRYNFGQTELCADATPSSNVFLVFNEQRSPLRENPKGTYCTIAALDSIATKNRPELELRTVYGSIVRQPLVLSMNNCDEQKLIALLQRSGLFVELNCDIASSKSCESVLKNCESTSIALFSAKTAEGPFERKAKYLITSQKTKGLKFQVGDVPLVYALTHSKDETPTIPVQVRSTIKE